MKDTHENHNGDAILTNIINMHFNKKTLYDAKTSSPLYMIHVDLCTFYPDIYVTKCI